MITAVDTNVLFDIVGGDRIFGPGSRGALRQALNQGALVACPIVWAEFGAAYSRLEDADEALARLGIAFDPIEARAASVAGMTWRAHRRSGGTRSRIISDFLIGAHARAKADRLLTRDRGFYRTYFSDLTILDPSGS